MKQNIWEKYTLSQQVLLASHRNSSLWFFSQKKDFVEIQPLCKEIGVTGRRPVLWDQVLGWWDAVGKVQGAH